MDAQQLSYYGVATDRRMALSLSRTVYSSGSSADDLNILTAHDINTPTALPEGLQLSVYCNTEPQEFRATLGCHPTGCAFADRTYRFRRVSVSSADVTAYGLVSFQELMISHCRQLGMKPVCDIKSQCEDDKNALYIGQAAGVQLSKHADRHGNAARIGAGWTKQLAHEWDGLCSYRTQASELPATYPWGSWSGSGSSATRTRGSPVAHEVYAACSASNDPRQQVWQTARENPSFMCGLIEFTAAFEAKTTTYSPSPTPARDYRFLKLALPWCPFSGCDHSHNKQEYLYHQVV